MIDVVIDTDILSTFIKIDRVKLLERLFAKSEIFLTPLVYRELKTGQRLGMIKMNLSRRFSKINLEIAEKRIVKEIKNRKLSSADLECIAVAKHRKCLLVTNDSHTEKEANCILVDHVNLQGILRMLWKSKIMTKNQLNDLIDQIEKKDRMVIGNKNAVFM